MVDDGRTDDGRTTDGRTTEHGYTISSPCEPDGLGELKMSPFHGIKVNGLIHLRQWTPIIIIFVSTLSFLWGTKGDFKT